MGRMNRYSFLSGHMCTLFPIVKLTSEIENPSGVLRGVQAWLTSATQLLTSMLSTLLCGLLKTFTPTKLSNLSDMVLKIPQINTYRASL